jgi:ATP-dependent Clp protease ATP-binding subunit ClpC
MADDPPLVPPAGAAPTAAGLDLAFGWLQRNLDELTAASRRRAASAPGTRSAAVEAPASAAVPEAVAPMPEPSVPPVDPAIPGSAAAAGPRPTPLLDQIGRDLTKMAAEGSLGIVIGRDDETAWMIEILLRSAKRNPILLGPAGVGKTAIVEGLAQRIVARKVPPALLGVRIIEVPLASLTAGTQYRGQLEERVTELVAEASQPGIILFLDEIHLLASAGRSDGGMGAGEILKPALSRGDIAVIGATTPEDYRTTIALDDSLARRFTTIVVPELDKTASRPILMSVRDALAKSRGVTATDDALDVLLEFADRSIANRRFPDKAIDLLEQAIAHAIVAGKVVVDEADAEAATVRWAARASSTPTLERFGRDLVGLARDGKLGPIVGRDRELDAIVEVLLRRTKRNPLLIGPAGSGKTAIVEGLAIRVAGAAVPEALRDIRIFDVPLLGLASGIADEPALLGDLLVEVRHPSVVVFFDEIHLLAAPKVRDLAESLKPALARGEIACIGATTAEEYQADIEPETALARRFSTIAIEPMDEAAVRAVLVAVRDSLAKLRGIAIGDDALAELTALAEQFLPNRAFPDKGVDLIEQAVSYAIVRGRTVVDVATAREAVAALIDMPLDPTAALAAVAAELRDRAILDPVATDALVRRLGVGLRGLDARAGRPSAVILLCDGATADAGRLAAALARNVFGRETAVIDIDLAAMTDDSSISTLLGSAPGLIGSERPLPLHDLRRSPWEVVLLRGIDTCAAAIRDAVAAALVAGFFTDAMGRRIPLGTAIVVLTAPTVGADAGGGGPTAAVLGTRLGSTLIGACDVVSGVVSDAAGSTRASWIQHELLLPLATRFRRVGYEPTFDAAFVAWLDGHLPTDGTSPDAFLDSDVTPRIVGLLPTPPGPIRISCADGQPTVVGASSAPESPAKT